MGLSQGYGVLIGTLADYYRDQEDDYGRYYHGNLIIRAPAGEYKCAVDVDPKFMPNGIQWRRVNIRARDFAALSALPDGWHPLASTRDSGALDYIRSRVLHPPLLIRRLRYGRWLHRLLRWLRWNPPWMSGTGTDALVELEAVIAGGERFFIFGEPFTTGLGVHNIHQNQGDPVGSGHDLENAIWQDGGTMVRGADGKLHGFVNKFATQSLRTDEFGRPR